MVDDISITRFGSDLLISNTKTQQTTVISGAYSREYNQLYNLEFYDKDTAIIDYSTTSLNITYAVKEEKVETESVEVTETQEIVSDMTDELTTLAENEASLYVQGEAAEMETLSDDKAVIVSEEDITKMTGLMVQEMVGADVDGVPQTVNPATNVVAESDSLLWSE